MSDSLASPGTSTGHGCGPASEWVMRWGQLVSPGAAVLDVACGRGRHSHWFAERGHPVTALDKDGDALSAIDTADLPITTVMADIEGGGWPLQGRTYGAVVVTNYLWRPLWPTLAAAIAPGGTLLYETFAEGNASVGRPRRPEFLLQHGELLQWCQMAGLRVIAYEDGFLQSPERFVQRVAAVRWEDSDESEEPPKRWPLTP
ncbi:class I SAM-dependent methyltransferase [Hydrogenophaga sp. 5NK40-0174]|uniref:class I SAM-dependent methyltransferase n=1 Tax=Hydrogenophaga sp. 5NK40-0174 TaxID=3127649 RepID=UPI003109E99D